jgi:hypothetical protein
VSRLHRPWLRVCRSDALKGETTQEKAAAEDQAAAATFIEVIAGRDAAWVPMGGWNANAKGGLRAWARKTLDGIMAPAMLARAPDGPLEAVAAYLLRVYQLLAEASSTLEADLRDHIEATIEDGCRLLLGIPSEAELAAASAASSPPEGVA